MRAHSKNEILLEDDAEEEHVMYDAWGDDVDVVVEVRSVCNYHGVDVQAGLLRECLIHLARCRYVTKSN